MAAPFRPFVALLSGALLLLSLAPLRGAAQAPASPAPTDDSLRVQWERALPPLTVTASRLPTTPAQAPARLTVIDSLALARTGAASVASALEARAGLFVRRYGDGGLATPALRGTGASQTALLLDGHPISDPQIGHLDLSLLPTVLLRSVEVMHGPASSLHGSDGLGGAIHLRTLRPQSSLRVRGTAHAGAFGERGGGLLVGGPLGDRTSVLAAADVQTTDGDFPYLDESQFPARTVRRRNADRVRRSLYGSVRSTAGAHRIRLSGWGTWAERGLPPPSSTASASERQWDTQLRLWGRDRVPVGVGQLTVQGLTQHTRLRYANPRQDLDQTGRTWVHSLEATLRAALSDRWTGAGGLSGSLARARHPRLAAAAHQEHLAAFAEGTGTYGRLRLYPALRADTYWMPDGATRLALSPRLGLNWQPVSAWSSLRLKAQVGRAFRVPTFNDRYWQPGGTPGLRPERSWGGDLGLWLGRPQGHLELTAFGHRRRDQIVWRPTDRGYWSPTNVGRVRVLGAEAAATRSGTLPFGPTLEGGLTYTLTDARTRTDPGAASYNTPLRYVPRHQLKVHSTVSWGPATLSAHARYTGRRYVTGDASQALAPYVVAGTRLQVAHTIGGVRTALALRVDNLLDTDYQSVGARPMPPRHAQLRLLVAP
jgi:iron complex outermembrane receptor protein